MPHLTCNMLVPRRLALLSMTHGTSQDMANSYEHAHPACVTCAIICRVGLRAVACCIQHATFVTCVQAQRIVITCTRLGMIISLSFTHCTSIRVKASGQSARLQPTGPLGIRRHRRRGCQVQPHLRQSRLTGLSSQTCTSKGI